MLWIALYCPTLPLDRIQRRFPEGLVPPLAVTNAGQGSRRRLLMVNAPAEAGGVRAGQSLASALALQPHLILIERDPADEHAVLHSAALAALRFTPNVLQKVDGFLLEVSASLRLFGGREALLHELLQSVHQAGLSVCVDWAGTAAAAWMLARHARAGQLPQAPPERFVSRLDALPVTLLEQAVPHGEVLAGIGCRTLADLRRLPRAGLARRFGPALLDEIDRARGKRPDPQRWLSPPERFEARLELMARVESAEALLFALQRLMTPLSGWLCARHAALTGLTLILHHEAPGRRHAMAPTQLVIHLAEPAADVAHLGGLLRERLTRLPLQAPVEEISLRVDDIVTQSAPNQELFATVQSEATSISRLIEKLVARLGADAVQRLQAVADHRPERAYAWMAVAQVHRTPARQVAGGAEAAQAAARPTARPVWLMPAPVPLEVRHHKPVHGSTLDLLAGPERIEAGWWDDALATRDYFIAANAAGQLLWVYRERQVLQQGAVWYLHGLFG